MKRAIGIAALGAVSAGPALADVTPQEVWDNLAGTMRSFGYSVEVGQTDQGGDLVLSDVVMSAPLAVEGTDDGEVSVTLSEITFSDQGDGTVHAEFPGAMPIEVTMPGDEDEPVRLMIDYTQTGLDMTVSGDPDDMVYDFTAEELALVLRELSGEGLGDEAPEVFDMKMAMGPVEGTTEISESGDERTYTHDLQLGDLTYDAVIEEDDGNGRFSGRMTGVASEGTTRLPVDADFSDPAVLASGGFGGSGVFTHQGSENEYSISEDGMTEAQGTLSSESGRFAVEMSEGSFIYDISGSGNQLDMSVQELPFPIQASIDETRLGLTLPLTPAEDGSPRDAAVALDLSGFTMADEIWAMFDPQRVLPRDPATVQLDLTAQVTPLVNFLDPEAVQRMEMTGGAPGELNALTLNNLRIEAVGSSLSGEGAFTFGESAEAFGGMPQPEGEVRLQASGVNRLMDALVTMGVMTEEDTMGMRMMMAMFTVPGSEPDTLSSTIEINEQGHVLANGQRIQ